ASARARTSMLSLHDALPISASGQARGPRMGVFRPWASGPLRARTGENVVSVPGKARGSIDGGRVFRLLGSADVATKRAGPGPVRSEEHTSELQSPCNLVCRL